jgi:hypothetical protein
MTTRNLHPAVLFLLLAAIAHLPGCARSVATMDSARQAFAIGDLTTASVTIKEVASDSLRMKD